MGELAERAVRRYLDLLRDALLGEHYLENELRIEHLLECVTTGRELDPERLADPARHMGAAFERLKHARLAGEPPGDSAVSGLCADGLAYAGLGRVRMAHLDSCLEAIRAERVEGDLVDAGAGRGGAAIYMRGFLEAHGIEGPRVWVADRFDGRGAGANGGPRFAFDLNAVREAFARFALLDERVRFLQGAPARKLAEAPIERIALLRVDSGDADEVRPVLDALYERVSPGGFVIVDDYGAGECEAAVDAFRSERGVREPLERVDWSAAAWRRAPARGRRGAARRAARAARRTRTKDLGVVVVAYNMRREAARTLHSLSRSYQRGVEDLDYEVIVVENGSAPEQRLGEELVRSFGEGFRYLDLGGDALPSPARAINRGIAASEARNLALMIDGAHLLTPGVLRFGMLGLTAYAPAIVVVKQWYLGPGQQPRTVASGYDQEFEDRLLAEIGWPADGYRLFEIGHFIGDRDWFDGEWESNCIFAPRELIEQAGAMDEAFSVPGGGYVNLDFFERMVGSPGVTLVTPLGEGSFHQVHGGTTTNVAEPTERIKSYEAQYEELRGHRFVIPPQRAHYVGSLPPAARRTKARRLQSFKHFREAHAKGREGALTPAPVPEDLRASFIDAFWRSGEWHRTPWLGKWTHRPPTDLFIYQELVHRLRPDWIVETRTGAGGRTLFLASVCDLVGNGRVLSLDGYPLASPPEHPRVTFLRADPGAPATGKRIREIVGEGARVLAILGGGSGPQVAAAFRNVAPLVPVGSYVVVEDTILQGNPVWPEFQPGPAAPLAEIIEGGEFAPDPTLERFALTFNIGGFLKRVRSGDGQDR